MSFFDENRTGWFRSSLGLARTPLSHPGVVFPLPCPASTQQVGGTQRRHPNARGQKERQKALLLWVLPTVGSGWDCPAPWGCPIATNQPDIQHPKTPPFLLLSVPAGQPLSSSAPGVGNLRHLKLAGCACVFPCSPFSPVPVRAALVWAQPAVNFPTSNFFSAIFLVLRLLPYLAITAQCPGS